MKTLTKELTKEILKHLQEVRHDFDLEEYVNCLEILIENQDKKLSETDETILTRIIDKEDLLVKIQKITEKKEKENIFD